MTKELKSINDLTPDDNNANKGTLRGLAMLEDSIEQYGPGRSILVDAEGRVIAGNKTLQAAIDKGIDVIVVPTDGDKLVVVQRRDLNLKRDKRARGKHSVKGMSQMIFNMLDNGWTEAEICNELGMEPEEVLRLKHITGFSKLFADREYNKAWVTRRQVLLRQKYEQESNGA